MRSRSEVIRAGRNAALAGLAAAALAPSARADARDVTGIFAGAVTRESVTHFVGSPPERCMTTSAAVRVCGWAIPAGSPAHERLVRELEGNDLRLVCDLHSSGAGRCTLHRESFARPGRGKASQRDDYRRPGEAQGQIAAALTLIDLSHLLGAVPDDCVQRDESEIVCIWRVQSGYTGHRIVAEAASTTSPARLVCRLPLDGGARGNDSCRALESD